jgi:Tfp pilus assembly protein PilO
MHIIDEDTRRFGRLLHYAGALLMVVSASTGYSMLHAPALEAITATSNRIDELMLSVQNVPVIREQHRMVSAKLNEVMTRIANVQRRVPVNDNSFEFLADVSQIAEVKKLAIKEINPGSQESKTGYAEMQLTLNSRGSFESICTFLDELNKLSRLSKIKDLTLSSETDVGEYPMTATLVIYFGLRGSEAAAVQEKRNG